MDESRIVSAILWNLRTFPEATNSLWTGIRGSNSRSQFGGLMCCHYTNTGYFVPARGSQPRRHGPSFRAASMISGGGLGCRRPVPAPAVCVEAPRFYVGAGAFFPTTKSQTSQFGAPESQICSGERLRLLWWSLFYIERSRYASPQGGIRLAARSVGRSRSCTGLSGRKEARRATAPNRMAGDYPAIMREVEKLCCSARGEKSGRPFAEGGECFAGPDGPFPSAPAWFFCGICGS